MQIADQIRATPPKDADELLAWIKQVTSPNKEELAKGAIPGDRAMVDLLKLVLKYFYHPRMGGSNSIKKVIPAVLDESKFLKDKYSRAIYGTDAGIQSLNFKDWTWLRFDDQGKVIDPYKLLPKVFDDVDDEYFEEGSTIYKLDSLNDGGAAMTAYARMQFTEMTDAERTKIREALLKYCELDTLSMVMLIEYFSSMLNKK